MTIKSVLQVIILIVLTVILISVFIGFLSEIKYQEPKFKIIQGTVEVTK
jgi:hypothetical protein